MPDDGLRFELEGVDRLRAALREIPDKLRTKQLRKALRDALRPVQARARALAPVLKTPKKGRKAGTLKKAIVTRVSKNARRDGNEGAYVSVRPLSKGKVRAFKSAGGESGKNNPDDPYYWSWVEFGHKIVLPASKGAASGGGSTTYQQRLRDGRVVTRTKKFSLQSITGRRRNSIGRVAPRPFLQPAAKLLGQSGQLFIDSMTAQIEKLDRENTLRGGR